MFVTRFMKDRATKGKMVPIRRLRLTYMIENAIFEDEGEVNMQNEHQKSDQEGAEVEVYVACETCGGVGNILSDIGGGILAGVICYDCNGTGQKCQKAS